MADLNNPQIRVFSNEVVRPMAERIVSLYRSGREMLDILSATGALNVIDDDPTQNIIDGAAQDGRRPITGEDIHNLVNQMTTFVNSMEANTRAKILEVQKISVRFQ